MTAHQFETRRSNLWAVRLGFWFGRGYSSEAIAKILGEGTTSGTVRGQLRKAQVLPAVPRQVVIPLHLPSWQRDAVAAKAAELGIDMETLIARMIESGVVFDDLYSAVTDGRYDRLSSSRPKNQPGGP